MPRRPAESTPHTPARQWSSTETVRAEILDAARRVFARRGFAEASISEVVEESGASVGGIYYHFSSKTGLFLALWERHKDEQMSITRDAVVAARASGLTDPFDLLIAGSRAYLASTWSRRDLVQIFQVGDTPAGFGEQQRQGGRMWIDSNFRLLGATDEPVNRLLVWLVTGFVGEARREICKVRNARHAREQVDAMIEVLKLMRPVLASGMELVVRDHADE